MNASNFGMKAVMLKNTNRMKNKVIEFVDPRSPNMFFKHICAKDKIIYYLLNSDDNIIGVISLDKIQFTDFQNTANNNKVYSFGIKMADGSSEKLSAFFIFEVWNDFINIRRNFIYCVNLNINFIKGFIEDLNKFYNIYYQLNSDTVDVIFGSKVEGKKNI